MTRLLALALALVLGASAAFAQGIPSGGLWVTPAYNYKNITTATTTTVKSGRGMLGSICPNSPSAETVTVYDNTAGSGTKIATITLTTSSIGCFYYNFVFNIGLTVVTSSTADITVGFQ